jgi:hypothetical protein
MNRGPLLFLPKYPEQQHARFLRKHFSSTPLHIGHVKQREASCALTRDHATTTSPSSFAKAQSQVPTHHGWRRRTTARPLVPYALAPLSHIDSNTDTIADRLPTVSASQALQSLHARGARTVSTGITQLDQALSPPSLPGYDVSGGYMRGKVTEVFGPSGVGKTAFG